MTEAERKTLTDMFRRYKEDKDAQDFFGKDVTFNRPSRAVQADLRHVHLNDGRKWDLRLLRHKHVSDMHLVYCKGFFHEDCYLLIALLKDAHNQYRDNLYMMGLADIAFGFRDRF